MYILNAYECPYAMCIQRLLLALSDLHIIITLGLYFEYIKVLCKIFIKCIATILQVYPNYFIIQKWLQMTFIIILFYLIYLYWLSYNKRVNF